MDCWDVWTPPTPVGSALHSRRLDDGGLRSLKEAIEFCESLGLGEYRVGSPDGLRQVDVVVTPYYTRPTEVTVDVEFACD